jgi:hypothetical protein
MNIHARFYLNSVNRGQGYYKAPGEEEAKTIESAQVTLNAVKGEPFGAYTPSGRLDMFIVNPTAAQVFFDARIGQEFDVLLSPVVKEEA